MSVYIIHIRFCFRHPFFLFLYVEIIGVVVKAKVISLLNICRYMNKFGTFFEQKIT